MKAENTLDELRKYFSNRPEVAMAFLFGSQATGRARPTSDFDIAVYFHPHKYLELETEATYDGEEEIRRDLDRLLAREVDFLVLNRARPQLVFSILNSGTPLIMRDQKLYLELLSKTHYEAVDFWQFAKEFWEIREKAASLTPEARANLVEHLTFFENEFSDKEKFIKISQKEYMENRDTRRNLERWTENIVMCALDMAKIILASDKREVPQTYRETLYAFGMFYLDETFAKDFSAFTDCRNILAHEYLDLKWDRIEQFLKNAAPLYEVFVKKIKELLA